MGNPDTEPRLDVLLKSLLSATRAGLVEWEMTDVEDEYRYEGDGGSVRCGSRDKDGVAPWQIKIHNPDGLMIERQYSYQNDTLDPLIAELCAVVRRHVHRVGEVVEGLIAGIPH